MEKVQKLSKSVCCTPSSEHFRINLVPVFEREKTVHALDRAATVIGKIPD
jgi:hypothetical protein